MLGILSLIFSKNNIKIGFLLIYKNIILKKLLKNNHLQLKENISNWLKLLNKIADQLTEF